MSERSPELSRSAFGPGLNPSQARFCSTVKQVSQAGINAEDILLSKASQLSHSSVLEFGDLHPGFRGSKISGRLRKRQASISCIRWTCPPKFILNDDWHVAAGDQSGERRVQEQRESGVTDLVYPHPSAIPSSPSISLDNDDGHNIPIIPIAPIEYDEAESSHEVEPPSSIKENVKVEVSDGVQTSHLMQHASQLGFSVAASKPYIGVKHPLGTLTGLEADIGAAASAAFTALIKSNEQGSLIDTDLLIKILSDPKMVELLKDAWSFGSEKATAVQDEAKLAIPSPSLSNAKQENMYMIQPSLDKQSFLSLNNPLSSPSRDPMKEGYVKLPTKMQLSSGILAMLASNTVIPSVPPPCSVPDMMLLLKQVCENQDKIMTQAHTASDFLKFCSSVDMAVPKSEQSLPQTIENPVHDSITVSKLPASSVAMSTRAPIIQLQEDLMTRFSTSTPPQPIRDPNYYKILVRQHGVERREIEGQKHIPKQFGNRVSLREPGNLPKHLQRQEHGRPKASSPKLCIYFNSPKGCRLGLSCPYMHDFSSTQLQVCGVSEAPTAKRVKLTRL